MDQHFDVFSENIVKIFLSIDQLQVEKSLVLFFETIVFNALIPNILLSRLFYEQKCIFFASKVGRFWNGLWLVNVTVT